MDDNKNIINSIIVTFIIGFIAGISPFIFMQLLPTMLNPGMRINPPNYLAIILSGTLIGAITSIIFAKKFKERDPQDVFFYALGIPAILIATVSNITGVRGVRGLNLQSLHLLDAIEKRHRLTTPSDWHLPAADFYCSTHPLFLLRKNT